jgi:hypothetical protein
VAFKALNENGKAVLILRERYGIVKAGRSIHLKAIISEWVSFHLRHKKEKFYKVKIISPANITQQYELPAVSETGVVMNFSNFK